MVVKTFKILVILAKTREQSLLRKNRSTARALKDSNLQIIWHKSAETRELIFIDRNTNQPQYASRHS